MSNINRTLIGTYFATGVFAAALGVFGLWTGHQPGGYRCGIGGLSRTPGSTATFQNLAVRVIAWPFSLTEAMQEGVSATDWALMRYDYSAGGC